MRIRVTNDSIKKARGVADKMRERIAEINNFLMKFDGEFWKEVSHELDGMIHNLTVYRENNFKAMSMDDLKANIAEESAYKKVKGMPARAREAYDRILKDRALLVKDINERADRIKE